MTRPRPPEDPLDWAPRAGAVDDVVREMEIRVAARRRRRRALHRAAVATAAVLVVALGILFTRPITPAPPSLAAAPASLPTGGTVSFPERQTLADGSVVELKRGARIQVMFSDSLRRVALLAGEAHFQVAKNPQRPFIVSAGAMEFRAVGTAFSVQLGQTEVELLVTEGRVAVDRPAPSTAASPPETLALVPAGNRLAVPTTAAPPSLADRVEPVAPTELNDRLAWRVPRLEFTGTPLGEAIPLFQRYTPVRLILGDADLAQLRLSGVLRADNVDTLLALLEENHGVRIERRSEREIVLRHRR